jgi:hypothetical protein
MERKVKVIVSTWPDETFLAEYTVPNMGWATHASKEARKVFTVKKFEFLHFRKVKT